MVFLTATINDWLHLLEEDENKDIIIDALQWLHDNKRADIFGFIIMPNHLHLIWKARAPFTDNQNAVTLIKFTGNKFKKKIITLDENKKNLFNSTQSDRKSHIWQRKSKSVKILNKYILTQKLDYIHNNAVRNQWQLCNHPDDYKYSSSAFYSGLPTPFSFLTHYNSAL